MARVDDLITTARALRVSALRTAGLAKLVHNLATGGAHTGGVTDAEFRCAWCRAPLGVADIAGFDKRLKFYQECVDLTNAPIEEGGI